MYLHARTRVAPLKLVHSKCRQGDLFRSPRANTRGPIEAESFLLKQRLQKISPRANTRGPIEADKAGSGDTVPDADLHARTRVAPLKPFNRLRASAIAAGSPRANTRGPIEAPNYIGRRSQRSDASPRANTRGPIEAKMAKKRAKIDATSPRANTRGPIEALHRCWPDSPGRRSPRANTRGPIEAFPSVLTEPGALKDLHARTRVAPLKQLKLDALKKEIEQISTREHAWPH